MIVMTSTLPNPHECLPRIRAALALGEDQEVFTSTASRVYFWLVLRLASCGNTEVILANTLLRDGDAALKKNAKWSTSVLYWAASCLRRWHWRTSV